MRMTLAALAASTLILASAASHAAAPGGHTGGGGNGTGATTTSHAANQGQGFNNGETIDTQCANILAGGDNSTSAERRYCRQRGY